MDSRLGERLPPSAPAATHSLVYSATALEPAGANQLRYLGMDLPPVVMRSRAQLEIFMHRAAYRRRILRVGAALKVPNGTR